MNHAFDQIIQADDITRLGLFTTTAQRLGTTPQNVEKDFWVCWTLDALFNGLVDNGPRLLFKGGTSLSKGFGLIHRFSEDIDVTVFRDDLGQSTATTELQAMSNKKRRAALDDIQHACEEYINGSLLPQLTELAESTCNRCALSSGAIAIVCDTEDRQTLHVQYPSSTPEDSYIGKTVKIESGAKSALDPNGIKTIRPYLELDVPDIDLAVANVTVVDAERTLWDKIVILHGLRRWFDSRGSLKGDGQRVSRHYYDLYCLLESPMGWGAVSNTLLGKDCVDHAKLFFNRPPFDLDTAVAPTFSITPNETMRASLERDYRSMSGMIFGQTPDFGRVIQMVAELERLLNNTASET